VQVDGEALVAQGYRQPRAEPLVRMPGALPVADGVAEDHEPEGGVCHVVLNARRARDRPRNDVRPGSPMANRAPAKQ
jgi:hypothetical protein